MSEPSPPVDPTDLEKEAVTLSLKATYFDENNIPETAAFYYVEAAEAILNAIKAGSKKQGLAQVSLLGVKTNVLSAARSHP